MIANRLWALDKGIAGGVDSGWYLKYISWFQYTHFPIIWCHVSLTIIQFYTIKNDFVAQMLKYKDERILKIQENHIERH